MLKIVQRFLILEPRFVFDTIRWPGPSQVKAKDNKDSLKRKKVHVHIPYWERLYDGGKQNIGRSSKVQQYEGKSCSNISQNFPAEQIRWLINKIIQFERLQDIPSFGPSMITVARDFLPSLLRSDGIAKATSNSSSASNIASSII